MKPPNEEPRRAAAGLKDQTHDRGNTNWGQYSDLSPESNFPGRDAMLGRLVEVMKGGPS